MTFLDGYFEVTPEGERDSAAIAYLAGLDHIKKNNPEIVDAIVQEFYTPGCYPLSCPRFETKKIVYLCR